MGQLLTDVLVDMLNPVTQEQVNLGKLIFVDIDRIKRNPLNTAPITAIEELKENILEGGLKQPLVVYKKNNSYMIHTGERRWTALKQLFEEGKEVSFMGKVLLDKVPVFVEQTAEDELMEEIDLMRSNSHRSWSKEQREAMMTQAHECYQKLCDRGCKPKGREREWITALLGYSDGSVKDFLTKLNKENELGQFAPETAEEDPQKKEKNTAEKILKKLNKTIDELSNLDFEKFSDDETVIVKIKINELIGMCEQIIQ
ncbi:ParB/RepB/Spo0J family partition protein [Holdemania massiliensis]|uniref:ParB/RepB/Spo0J family partition protein n=1 Tax=Holdemania massiliensis TaxID=1468449 RepID=UPI001F05B85C|nr:ParB/RepB/Spo0J family partition protein [Holdemania massiliensis]MCH1942443.1 ParB/RepB/Spo0J family partition protein [Holdemania massiliensis]